MLMSIELSLFLMQSHTDRSNTKFSFYSSDFFIYILEAILILFGFDVISQTQTKTHPHIHTIRTKRKDAFKTFVRSRLSLLFLGSHETLCVCFRMLM